MFTGLIEAVGRVAGRTDVPGGFRLDVSTDLAPELTAGDSLAVNGVCLTVVAKSDDTVSADVSPETARVTALAELRPGSLVNLERPLRADARLGGHFVQGHVDGIGTVEAVDPEGDCHRLTIRYPALMAANLVPKGSIAVDGISLTLASVDDDRFSVQIIPYSWSHTNLQRVHAGDRVNLECDVLGKYVIRFLEQQPAPAGALAESVRRNTTGTSKR
jgi:riboflavin synthase alpha subunit